MKLTRDSLMLSVVAIGAAAGFLATMPPPTEWSYAQWMQIIAGAALWLSGKLATSWLKGEHD